MATNHDDSDNQESKAGSGSKDTREAREEEARELALTIAAAALEHKALNVEIIDVRGKVDYSDYVIVMSGRSDRQVTALGNNIEEVLQRKHSVRVSSTLLSLSDRFWRRYRTAP